jgi:RimJ/RimL family protein N-acetyltransferase
LIAGEKVILREKRVSDVENDYAWRCDPELARYDGILPLKMSYQEYALYYAWDMQNGGRMKRWFAIDSLDEKHIGNCMYYEIDEDRKQAKLGIMIGDRKYWDKGYGTDAVSTLVSHVFEQTKLDRIYLDTLEWNVRAQRCFRKCGFIACGRTIRQGNDFLVMELRRSWLKPAEANAV